MRVPLAKPACLIALVAIGVMCSRQAEAKFAMGVRRRVRRKVVRAPYCRCVGGQLPVGGWLRFRG